MASWRRRNFGFLNSYWLKFLISWIVWQNWAQKNLDLPQVDCVSAEGSKDALEASKSEST